MGTMNPTLQGLQQRFDKQRNLVLGRGNFLFPALLKRWEEYFGQTGIVFDEQAVGAVLNGAGGADEKLVLTGRLSVLFAVTHVPVAVSLFYCGADLQLLLE